jgi:hypothetical protein
MIISFENIDNTALEMLNSEYNLIDADNFLNTLVNENFPFGFKSIPNEIILMKIIYLKNKNDFEINRLSPFYFANEGDIENIIGILGGANFEGEPYLIRVKTVKNNIDIEKTLRNNLLYQFEYSTILKTNSKVEIIAIEKL